MWLWVTTRHLANSNSELDLLGMQTQQSDHLQSTPLLSRTPVSLKDRSLCGQWGLKRNQGWAWPSPYISLKLLNANLHSSGRSALFLQMSKHCPKFDLVARPLKSSIVRLLAKAKEILRVELHTLGVLCLSNLGRLSDRSQTHETRELSAGARPWDTLCWPSQDTWT